MALCSADPGGNDVVGPDVVALRSKAMDDWAGSMSRLTRVKVPGMVLSGSEDVLTPPRSSQRTAAAIPASRPVRFPGAGHGLPYRYPLQAAAVIIAFLKSSVVAQ